MTKATLATGRRKNAVAVVRLLPGNGKLMVNKRPFNEYFPVDIYQMNAMRPLLITKNDGKFDVNITVKGGGLSGQTGAVALALARALVIVDNQLHVAMRDAGLLTRDPRMVERKKYGRKKARKRFQFSKR
jgi:small subunit ribosomal protein S9